MADIIQFPPDDSFAATDESAASHDTFLVDEGLDLLAAFRRIDDPAVRASIMQLIKSLSGSRRMANGA